MKNTEEAALAAVREALGKTFASDELAKSGINTATGLLAYDLRDAALLHIPVLTPLRNKLGRIGRVNPGATAHWKTIRSMTGSGIDSMGYVPEGQRSGKKSITVIDASATYTTIGEEGSVTDQAVLGQMPATDTFATDNMLTLWKTMLKEENSLLAGNRSIKLGTPTTPTVAASGTGGTVAAAATYVAVVALTNEGMQAASLVSGVPTTTTVTGADGQTYTVNGGSSNKSVAGTATPTAGQVVTATTPAIPGAVGYAWYVGASNTASAMYLQAITTVNSFVLSAPFVTTTQAASAITADSSFNDGTGSGSNQVTAYDGIMTSALVAANGAYSYALPTGTLGTGTALTSNLSGGCVEVDNMIVSMWNANKVQVDVLYMSANTLKALTKVCSSGSAGASLMHIYKDADGRADGMVGGSRMKSYVSPVGNPYGGDDIAIFIHPNLPDGVITGWASELPIWYRNNETPAVAQVLTRQDYFGIEWPKRTRAREYGVYTDQVLAVYAAWATGVIYNISVQ